MVKTIGNVQKDAQVRAVASGALSNGDTVIVNSDGTVSAVSETIVNPAFGSKAQFESGNTSKHAVAYDSTNNRVVFVYSDDDNSNYGTACVGQINTSDNSISFGTPVVFESATVSNTMGATFDSSAGKIVISYQDGGNSNYGTAIVGTVSGTSITFGTAVVFETANSYEPLIAYDTNASKCLIIYNKNSAFGEAIVGTVSGTSISFGSPSTFQSNGVSNYSLAFDSNQNRFLIAYRDDSATTGKGVVATISGTSVNFSTVVTFESGSTWDTACSYDSDNQVVIVFYRDNGNSDYATAVIGTISGNAVSFSTPEVLVEENWRNIRAVYDPIAQKTILGFRTNLTPRYGQLKPITLSGTTFTVGSTATFNSAQTTDFGQAYASSDSRIVFGFKDGGNGGRGNAIVYNAGSITRNLTSDNFIGFADGAYADTQSAVINTACSVHRSQTSLTAGQKYYVQTDGSLGLTAADPSVEAGTAISSTEILVKG